MSETYTKLLSSLPLSTVWMEPHPTRIVWVTMLALADHNGDVFASVPGLAHTARVTLDECRVALDCFMAPDEHSRNPDNDGRRIAPIAGGWRLLNHSTVKMLHAPEDRREYQRQWDRENRPSGHARSKQSDSPTQSDTSPTESAQSVTPNQTRPDQKEQKPGARKRGTRLPDGWRPSDEGIRFAHNEGIDVEKELASFCDYWTSKAGASATKLDWDATWRNWARRSQKVRPSASTTPSKVTGAAAALAPTESKLERETGWINNQHRLGQITDAERLLKLREARERYGNGHG